MRIHTVAQVFSVMCIASLLYWLRVTLISSHHYIMIYAILLKSLSDHQDTQDTRALFSSPVSPFSNISESTFMRKLVDLIVSVWCGQFTTRAKLHIFSVILFLVSLLRNILNFGRLVKIICHELIQWCTVLDVNFWFILRLQTYVMNKMMVTISYVWICFYGLEL